VCVNERDTLIKTSRSGITCGGYKAQVFYIQRERERERTKKNASKMGRDRV